MCQFFRYLFIPVRHGEMERIIARRSAVRLPMPAVKRICKAFAFVLRTVSMRRTTPSGTSPVSPSPHIPPIISSGVRFPTNMASTCCRPSTAACRTESSLPVRKGLHMSLLSHFPFSLPPVYLMLQKSTIGVMPCQWPGIPSMPLSPRRRR